MAAQTFREKKSTLFLCLHTWITEKELKQVIENKGDEFRWKNNMKILQGRSENEKCLWSARSSDLKKSAES